MTEAQHPSTVRQPRGAPDGHLTEHLAVHPPPSSPTSDHFFQMKPQSLEPQGSGPHDPRHQLPRAKGLGPQGLRPQSLKPQVIGKFFDTNGFACPPAPWVPGCEGTCFILYPASSVVMRACYSLVFSYFRNFHSAFSYPFIPAGFMMYFAC